MSYAIDTSSPAASAAQPKVERRGPASASHHLTPPNRRPDIQGLRAVAVLMVVAFHAKLPLPGGFVGVDVFFVISGFVITAMLTREQTAYGRIRFARFYSRRFKRLIPALALMVASTVVTSALILSPLGSQQVTVQTATGAMLFAANIVLARTTGGYCDLPSGMNPLLNTWSLSVEEQFYLVFPAGLAATWILAQKIRALKSAPLLAVGLVSVTSFGLAVLSSSGGTAWYLGFYSPFTRAWEFAAGAILALAGARLRITSRTVALAFGLLGAAFLVLSLRLITEATPFPGIWTLLPVAGAMLLIIAGNCELSPITRLLAARPVAKIGDWSYSIYLWHWPFIVFAGVVRPNDSGAVYTAAVLSIIPAIASYYLVEQPIRAIRSLSIPRFSALVVATIAAPLILVSAVTVSIRNSFWSPDVKHYLAATSPWHTGLRAKCDTAVPQSQRKPGDCVWNGAGKRPPIYLVGDSNADHFSEAVIGAGNILDRPVILSTTNSCPMVDLFFRRINASQSWNDQCHAYVQGTLKYLSSSVPGVVIIASTDLYWLSREFTAGPTARQATDNAKQKLQAFDAGLTSTVRAIQQAGHKIILIQTTPKWTNWQIKYCSTFKVATHQCKQTMTTKQAESRQGQVRQIVQTVANTTNALVLDLWPTLCPNGVCSTDSKTLVRYRDESHISVPQAKALIPDFTSAITRTTT